MTYLSSRLKEVKAKLTGCCRGTGYSNNSRRGKKKLYSTGTNLIRYHCQFHVTCLLTYLGYLFFYFYKSSFFI